MASFQTFRLVPLRDDIRDESDEWAGVGDSKERRKRQNRINQRAARRRQKLNEISLHNTKVNLKHQPSPSTSSNTTSQNVAQTGTPLQPKERCSPGIYFPLTRDSELLHVISINVSRAILTNYFIISSIPFLTSQFCTGRRILSLPCNGGVSSPQYGTWSEVTMPPSLMPTNVQQRVAHAGWIDLFPSPQLRDNLILALEQDSIDEDAFMMDLVGEAFSSLCAGDESEELNNESITDQYSHENTATWIGESGLVSWSDPWDIGGWEVTETFARKWGFLLRGCQDVVAAANTWREIRGEDPLEVEV